MSDGSCCHYCRRYSCICRQVEEIFEKINSYRDLKPNWDGEGAETISEEMIKASKQFVHDIAMATAKKGCSWREPSVAPNYDGGIDLVWELYDEKEAPYCMVFFEAQYQGGAYVVRDVIKNPNGKRMSLDESFDLVIEVLREQDKFLGKRRS